MLLPVSHCDFLCSCLSDRYLNVKVEYEYFQLKEILAGVPQGSVLEPVLYMLYTSDMAIGDLNTTATFADDAALLTVGSTAEESTSKLQFVINQISDWSRLWKSKLKNAKSIHAHFTNKCIQHNILHIDNTEIPYSNKAKFLGMTLGAKLHWSMSKLKNKNSTLHFPNFIG